MSLREKAIEYLSRSAADRSPRKFAICAVAPLVFFTILCAIAVGLYYLGKLMSLPEIRSPIATFVGYPFIIVGLMLMLGSVSQFLYSRGTPVPMNPPPKLVSGGLYHYVRNPMVAGLFIFVAGLGLLLGSLTILLVLLPLLVAALTWEIKSIEEPELAQRLGQDYLDYRSRTPMFFPRLWRPKADHLTGR